MDTVTYLYQLLQKQTLVFGINQFSNINIEFVISLVIYLNVVCMIAHKLWI